MDERKRVLVEQLALLSIYRCNLTKLYNLQRLYTRRIMNNLRKLREMADLSQAELSNRVGIKAGRYNHYESGRRELPVSIAKQIGKVLGIDWWILYEEEI